jgi:thiazole synthase
LPNSAGCTTAREAVRLLQLARAAGDWRLVKLEVIGDPDTLYPDMFETLEAAKILTEEGFEVMAYCTDDLCACQRLQEVGCVAVMPLAAPIGSGLGIQNLCALRHIIAKMAIPVLVDAGIGAPSHATQAMEQGCAGVLLNTALAEARDPVAMATAMRFAVQAGRIGYCAGLMQPRAHAVASSPSWN